MLQLMDSKSFSKFQNFTDAYYEGDFIANYYNGAIKEIRLKIEKCKPGKNINIKYRDIINNDKQLF